MLLAVLLLPRSGRELLVRHDDCDVLAFKRDGMRVRKSRCWRPPLPVQGSTLCRRRAWVRGCHGVLLKGRQLAAELLAKTGFMVPLARKIGPNVAAHSAARWAAFQRKQELLSPAGAAPGGESKGNKRQGPTVAAPARA